MLQVATLSPETNTIDLKTKILENQVEIYERDVVGQKDPQMSKIQQIENSVVCCDDKSDDKHGGDRFISKVKCTKRACENNTKCSENSGELSKKRCRVACNEKDGRGRSTILSVAEPFILDIDLDFFSTANPFKEMYSEYQYNLLRKLYFCKLPKEADDKVRAHPVHFYHWFFSV